MTGGAQYSVSDKLIDSVSKKPISGKEVSATTDGGSPKGSDTTNSKGEFEVNLKAADSPGNYDIKAQFDGDITLQGFATLETNSDLFITKRLANLFIPAKFLNPNNSPIITDL